MDENLQLWIDKHSDCTLNLKFNKELDLSIIASGLPGN